MPPGGGFGSEDDVVFRIAGDVDGMLDALKSIDKTLLATLDKFSKFADAASDSTGKAGTGVDDLSAKLTKAATLGTFFGTQMNKAFDMVVDGVKSAATMLPNLVKEVAATGDRFLTMSQQMGVSVETISELDYVASQTGTSLPMLGRAIADMNRVLGSGSDSTARALNKLGLNINALKNQKPEEAFTKIMASLRDIPNAADRAAVGTQVFGNKFRLFSNLAQEDIAGLRKEADELGLKMDELTGKAGDAFGDAVDRFDRVFEGFRRKIGAALLPAATELVKGFTDRVQSLFASFGVEKMDWASVASEGVKKLLAAFDGLVEAVRPLMPVLRQLGSTILAALPAFMNAFVSALKAGLPIIAKVAEVIGSMDATTVKAIVSMTAAGTAAAVASGSFIDTSASAATIVSGVSDAAKAMRAFASVLGNTNGGGGVLSSVGDFRAGLDLLSQQLGLTFKSMGALGTAATLLGAAFVGWQIGTLIAELTGLDDIIADLLSKSDEVQKRRREQAKTGAAGSSRSLSEIDAELKAMEGNRAAAAEARRRALLEERQVVLAFHDEIQKAIKATGKADLDYTEAAKINRLNYLASLDIAKVRELSVVREVLAAKVELGTISLEQSAKMLEAWRKESLGIKEKTDAEKLASLQTELAASSLAKLSAAAITGARAMYDKKKSVGEIVKALVDYELITNDGAEAVAKLVEQWTKADKPLKDIRDGVESLGLALKGARDAGLSQKELVERFGGAATKIVEDAKAVKGGLKAVTQELLTLSDLDKQKTFAKLIQPFTASIIAAGRPEVWAPLRQQTLEYFALFDKLASERRLDGKTGLNRKLTELKLGLEAEINAAKKAKEANAQITQAMLDEQIAGITRRYQHEVDLATGTSDTIVERMAGQGVKTQAMRDEEVAALRRDYEQMVRSGKYSADELYQAWKRWKDADAANNKTWASSWSLALSTVGQAFETLANVAGDTFSAIAKGIGTAAQSLSIFGESITNMKKGWTTMKAGFGKQGGFSDMLSGAVSMIGAIGQLTSMAIQLGKALHDAFTRSDAEKTAADLRRQFGLSEETESSALTQSITKSQEKYGIDRRQALALQINAVVAAQGGLTAQNYNQTTERVWELLRLVKSGSQVSGEALKNLNTALGSMGDYLERNGKLWDTDFIALIEHAKASGTEMTEVIRLLNTQMEKVGGGLAKVTAGFSEQLGKALDQSASKLGLTAGDATSKMKELRDIEAEMKRLETQKGTYDSTTDAKKIREIEDAWARLDARRKELGPEVDKIRRANGEIVVEFQDDFDRLNRIALASFNAFRAQGKSIAEAIQLVGPSIDQLMDGMEQFGFQGNAAYEQLARWRKLTTDNAALIDSVSGLSDVMSGLANLGQLNADTFKDMQVQGKASYDQLIAAGFTQEEALSVMAPMLQTIVDLHRERGLAIDEETQRMIDQADAAGLLQDQQATVQEVLADGFKMMADGMGALIEALGGEVPAALQNFGKAMDDTMGQAARDAEQAAQDIQKSFDGIQVPTIGGYDGAGTEPLPTDIPSFDRRPMERVVRTGLALLHPGDLVGVPHGNASGGPNVSIHIDAIDADSVRKKMPMITRELLSYVRRSADARTTLRDDILNRP